MPALKVRLRLRLWSHRTPNSRVPRGALFHRWIPNGREDAITLTDEKAVDVLRVWFERTFTNQHGLLEWSPTATDFDEHLIARQCKLESGPLCGELRLQDISNDESQVLRTNVIEPGDTTSREPLVESPTYVALAKRVIKIVQPALSRFVDLLRTQYGQYWLEEVRSHDSRVESLGSYCAYLGLFWFNEESEQWYPFIPTPGGFKVTIRPPSGRGYSEYLTREDWQRLRGGSYLQEIPLEVFLLGEAVRSLQLQQYRQAFVEAASSLDVAISRRFQVGNITSSLVKSAIQGFLDKQGLTAATAVAFHIAGISHSEIEVALRVLKIRNQVVHDGYSPEPADISILREVLSVLAGFIGLEEFKLPELTSSNALMPPG